MSPLRHVAGTLITLLLSTTCAQAHPLGNMGIGQYSELVAGARRIVLHYALDFAEIPTFLETRKQQPDAAAGAAAAPAFMRALTAQIAHGLSLNIDGRPVALAATLPCEGRYATGAADMLTLRVTCEYSVALPAANAIYRVHYHDQNFSQRSGWKEVVLRAESDANVLTSSVPARGRSAALSAYPEDAARAPAQVRDAQASVQRNAQTAAR